jgi:hypothetical protein
MAVNNQYSFCYDKYFSSAIPREIDRELMENLDNVKMSEHEHLSTYLKRVNQAIKAYDGSGVAVPALPLQVALFIRNLNDSKFRDFKIHIRSEYHQAALSYPDDIKLGA